MHTLLAGQTQNAKTDLFMTIYNTGCRRSDKNLYSKSTHNIEDHVQEITGINQCPCDLRAFHSHYITTHERHMT
jgi:hypothetical protein